MPSLTVNNETTITNVNRIALTAIPIVNPRISVITVAGQKGDKGDPGIAGTGGGSTGISQFELDATGNLLSSKIEQTGSILNDSIIQLSGFFSGKDNFPNPIFSREFWVNKAGSDIFGDGTPNKPFFTIQKALENIVQPTYNSGYNIYIGPGTYSGDMFVPEFTNLIGDNTIVNQNFTGIIFTGEADYNYNKIEGFQFDSNYYRIQSSYGFNSKLLVQNCYSDTGYVVISDNGFGTRVVGGNINTHPVKGQIYYENGKGRIFANDSAPIEEPDDSLNISAYGWTSMAYPLDIRYTGFSQNAHIYHSYFRGIALYGPNSTLYVNPESFGDFGANFPNLGTLFYTKDASTYPYTPTTGRDWEITPSEIGPALDILAGKNSLLFQNLEITGQKSWDYTSNISGNIESTGQKIWNETRGNAINLSGDLNVSGRRAWNDAINLSGNLELTGQNSVNYTDLRVETTGQSAWIASQNNAFNISGSINSSGRGAWDNATNLSGGLFSTGNLSISHANGIGINLSGRLTATGTLLSAVTVTGSTLVKNVNFTGIGGAQVLLSGGYVVISGGAGGGSTPANNSDGINLSGNLSATGNILWQRDLNISGVLAAQIAENAAGVSTLNSTSGALSIVGTGSVVSISTLGQSIYISGSNNDAINLSGRLTASGQNLLGIIANTGQTAINYTDTKVASTGQQVWIAGQSNSLNLSGNLQLTGSNLYNIIINESGSLLSSISNSISGLISTGSGDIRYYPYTSNPSGYIGATQTGQFYPVSNPAFYATSGNLALTGQGLTIIVASTGQQAWAAGNNNATNLSGNLQSTGQKNWLFEVADSGNLTITGQALIALIASTGQQAWISANGAALGFSGNLALTGQTAQNNALNISGNLASTGQQAWTSANNNALNLSGRLAATGALLSSFSVTGSTNIQTPNLSGIGGTLVVQSGNFVLISGAAGVASSSNNGDGVNLSGRFNSLSGALSETGSVLWQRDLLVSGALDAKIAAGGSAVKVTGSNAISTVDFTGYGTTLVFLSGNKVYVSGAAGGGVGGGLTQAQVLTLTSMGF